VGYHPQVVSKNYTDEGFVKAPPQKNRGAVEVRGTPRVLASQFPNFQNSTVGEGHLSTFVLSAPFILSTILFSRDFWHFSSQGGTCLP